MAKDDTTAAEYWMFDCPIHGLVTSVFCFRAFDPENKDKWLRGKLVFVDTSVEERDKHFSSFVERARNTASIFGSG